MPLPKAPITIQVSPDTYMLMMKMIELGVVYDANNDLQLNPAKPNLQARLDALYTELVAGTATTVAELRKLQQDGLNEASEINKKAGSEVALPT